MPFPESPPTGRYQSQNDNGTSSKHGVGEDAVKGAVANML